MNGPDTCWLDDVNILSITDRFSPNACVDNHYVSGRRPVPGPLKNYLSRNMIAISRQSAGGADVPTVFQTLGHTLPTDARLTRSYWVNPNKLATSPFCLVREKVQEHT